MSAGEKLVGDASETENVIARIRRYAAQYLRARVGGCARGDSRIFAAPRSRGAEIEHLDLPARAHEDICRLEVAVHDAPAVRIRERSPARHQNGALERKRQRRRLAKQRRERTSFYQLHRHEPGLFVAMQFQHACNVRVRERLYVSKLVLEPRDRAGGIFDVGSRRLDRDVCSGSVLVVREVARAKYPSRAASSQRSFDQETILEDCAGTDAGRALRLAGLWR